MHELNLRDLNQEQLTEESLINLAYAILEEKHQPMAFAEIMEAIIDLGARTSEQMKTSAIQFYTDINIDGRFLVLGENRWGIREWYAIEQVEEETAPTVKVRKKKAKAAIVDDEIHEDEEIDFDEDFDEFVDDDDDDTEEFDAAEIDDIDEDELDEEIEIEDEEIEIEDEGFEIEEADDELADSEK